jgi:ABC-type multidrug transport system fused ATPase/permease subunit
MATDTALIEKREELKRQLAAGEYKTLVDVFLAWTNGVIQKITRRSKPLPLWLMTVFLSLVIILILFGAVYVAGDFITIRNIAETLGSGFGLGVLSLPSIVIAPVVTIIVLNQSVGRVFVLWRDDILDATESAPSLHAFEDWLEKVCNRRLHFRVTIFWGLLFGLLAVSILSTNRGEFMGYGYTFAQIILAMISFAFFYQAFLVIPLPAMLRRYDLKLFAADPATSELLSRLSSELSALVYFVAFYSAIATLTIVAMGTPQTTGLVLVLFLWLPIIAMFIWNQTSLSSIIRRAKWKTLNEIQAKVEKLQAVENFEDKETMDSINRLMDYHDRVKATRDSALDFRAYLNFINSLLLPLLAFLLGNLDLVLSLFKRQP